MPWGQKKNTRARSQSQTVTGPLPAITGTTFRFVIATTNRSTRSARPRTRFRPGALESEEDMRPPSNHKWGGGASADASRSVPDVADGPAVLALGQGKRLGEAAHDALVDGVAPAHLDQGSAGLHLGGENGHHDGLRLQAAEGLLRPALLLGREVGLDRAE